MTATFRLRDADPADVADVRRLILGLAAYEHLLHEVRATDDDIREALFGPLPRVQAILAETGGVPVGLALFYYTFNTFKAVPNIFLEDLFVEPEHRGAGIGLALMRHLAARAVAENCQRIEWRVLNWNQPAIDFYQQIGAKPIENWHTLQLGGEALAALSEGHVHG